MFSGRFDTVVFFVAVVSIAASPAVRAAAPSDAEQPPKHGVPQQPGDDVILPLNPIVPRSEAERRRVEAVAWFMTGELRQSRNDFRGAFAAFEKAVELDPKAVEAYRALVPLAFTLKKTDEAVKFALKAIELDPNDYNLLRQLGVHMAAREGNIPAALKLMEQAADSKTIDKRSATYVSLMRDLAVLYAETGNTEKAADSYEVVFDARRNPRKYDLDARTIQALEKDERADYEQIGQVFLEAKRFDPAIEAFELAAEKQRGRPGSLNFNLAQVYLQTDQPEKAHQELRKYLDAQLQSKGRAPYELLADILKELERPGDLLPELETLAEKDPRNSMLQYFLAEQYVAADRLKEAEELYKKVLADTGDVEGHAGLAVVYRLQGRAGDLLDELSKAAAAGRGIELLTSELETVAENESLRKEVIAVGRERLQADPPEIEFPAGYLLAKLSALSQQTDDVLAFYRFALNARRDRAPLLYEELGDYLLEVEDFDEAAKVYREAADDPALAGAKPNFLFRLSQALEMAGETQAALDAVAEARKILPDNALLEFQEGWIHYHSRNWDKAIVVFERVIAEETEATSIVRRCQFMLSNVYVQRGEMRKGEKILEDVYAEDPDDISVNNDLGYLYADQGKNLEQAEKMIRKALDAEPENAAYLDSMGWVLFKLGKYQDAVAYLEKAAASPSGGDPTILDHLADCYKQLGRDEKARELWTQALAKAKDQKFPDSKLIKEIEQKLAKGE